MKSKLPLLTVAIAITLLSMTGWVDDGARHNQSPLSMPLIILPPIPEDCEASCEDATEWCSTPNWERHQYDSGFGAEGWSDDYEGGTHCATGSCKGHGHSECNPELDEDDLDDLYMALTTLFGADLQRLLARNAERLVWNAARLSVQLIGCGGRIQASVPLSHSQVASLPSD